MTYFYVFSALLVAFTFLYILWQWRRAAHHLDQAQVTNVQVVRQRLSELGRETEEGLLTEQDLADSEQELKLALLDEASGEETMAPTQSAPKTLMAAVLIVATLTGVGTYWYAGEHDKLTNWEEAVDRLGELSNRVVMQADETVTPEELQLFALGMRTKLITDPDDKVGWLLLGRLFATLGRPDTAIESFDKALEIDPNHIPSLSSLSQVLVRTGDDASLSRAKRILIHLQTLDDDINHIGLLAVTATQLGDIELALDQWRSLQSNLNPSEPMYAEIQKRIDQLSGNMTSDTSAGNETASRVSIEVEVNLDNSLASRVPEQAYLFVFAQDALSESRVPAAVVRTQEVTFPITITLSDENAMMPSLTLSMLSEAKITARLSRDDQVTAARGDLEGQINVTISGDQQVSLTIDKELE